MLRQMGAVEHNGDQSETVLGPETMFNQLPGILQHTYKFVWETPQEGDELEEEEKAQPSLLKPRPKKRVVNEPLPFHLKKFLEVTSSHRPSHSEWLQLVYYCASIGMPRAEMQHLDNRNNSCPYTEYDRRQPGRDSISRGSVVRYLNLYGKNFEWESIFPRRTFEYLSEYDDFLFSTGTTWNRQILGNYLTDTVCYIKKSKKYVYKDFEIGVDRNGNEKKIVSTYIVDKPPFSGGEDIEVQVPYKAEKLLKIIDKRMPKKTSNDTNQLKLRLELLEAKKMLEKPSDNDIRQVTVFLELDPLTK